MFFKTFDITYTHDNKNIALLYLPNSWHVAVTHSPHVVTPLILSVFNIYIISTVRTLLAVVLILFRALHRNRNNRICRWYLIIKKLVYVIKEAGKFWIHSVV